MTNIITPIVAAIFGQPDFSALSFTLNGSEILYGAFLNSVIGFLIIVTAIFFLVVKPINATMNRMRTEPTPDPLTGKCPFCLSEIQVGATRCAFCTQEIEPMAPENREEITATRTATLNTRLRPRGESTGGVQIAEQRGAAQDYHSQAMTMPRMVTTAR